MTVYNFNLLVGYVSTGVDYAQAYRAKILRGICDQKYVFLEAPQYRELGYYSRIGIGEEEIMVLPFYFAGAEKIFPSLSFDRVRNMAVPDDSDYILTGGERIKRLVKSDHSKEIIFHLTEGGYVHTADHYFRSVLIKRDHYSDRLLFTEYMRLEKTEERTFVRVCGADYFYEDGRVALEEIHLKDGRIYVLPDGSRLTQNGLLERFLCSLHLSSGDFLLLDRTDPHLLPVLKCRGEARLGFFMHSRLTFPDASDSHHWKGLSYEYTDLIRHAECFDRILTSTKEQAAEVEAWLKERGRLVRASAIPAGGMKKLTYPEGKRKRFGLVTVSRLDHRKRVDLLIRAAALARRSLPELTLDIYGEGPERGRYQGLIESLGAGDYIRLMGYVPGFDRYGDYEVYVSASLWETFGLSLLEAVSGGLALIGLDVPYGNRCFIKDGQNGFLIPYEGEEEESKTAEKLAEAVVRLYEEGDLEAFSACSYKEAGAYSVREIRKKWIRLLEEMGLEEAGAEEAAGAEEGTGVEKVDRITG